MRLLLVFFLLSVFAFQRLPAQTNGIPITWQDTVEGDFSFTKEWSYNVNVFRNQKGQLVCDGFCDPQLEKLRNRKGTFKRGKAKEYYASFDTSHFRFNAKIESDFPEFIGTNFVALKYVGDSLKIFTKKHISNHSWLEMYLYNDSVKIRAFVNSVSVKNNPIFTFQKGTISLSKKEWENQHLLGNFTYFFKNESTGKTYYWEGRIDSPIPAPGETIKAPSFDLGL